MLPEKRYGVLVFNRDTNVTEADIYDFKNEYLKQNTKIKPGTKEKVFKSLCRGIERDENYIKNLFGPGH